MKNKTVELYQSKDELKVVADLIQGLVNEECRLCFQLSSTDITTTSVICSVEMNTEDNVLSMHGDSHDDRYVISFESVRITVNDYGSIIYFFSSDYLFTICTDVLLDIGSEVKEIETLEDVIKIVKTGLVSEADVDRINDYLKSRLDMNCYFGFRELHKNIGFLYGLLYCNFSDLNAIDMELLPYSFYLNDLYYQCCHSS